MYYRAQIARAMTVLVVLACSCRAPAEPAQTTTAPADPEQLRTRIEALLDKAAKVAGIVDNDPYVRHQTAKEIARLTSENPEVCIPLLLDNSAPGANILTNPHAKRLVALEALELAGASAKGAIPVLAQRLSEALALAGPADGDRYTISRGGEKPEVVIALARTLLGIGPHDESVVPVLVKALSHGEPYVRGYAVDLLVKFGPRAKPAKEALVPLLDDYPWISRPARASLRIIAPDDTKLQHTLDVLDFCDLTWAPEVMLWPVTVVLQVIVVAGLAWGAWATRGERRRMFLYLVVLLALPIPLSEWWRAEALAMRGGGLAFLILNILHVIASICVWIMVSEDISDPQLEGDGGVMHRLARDAISILPTVLMVWALPLLCTPLVSAVKAGGTGNVSPPPGYTWVGGAPMEFGWRARWARAVSMNVLNVPAGISSGWPAWTFLRWSPIIASQTAGVRDASGYGRSSGR